MAVALGRNTLVGFFSPAPPQRNCCLQSCGTQTISGGGTSCILFSCCTWCLGEACVRRQGAATTAPISGHGLSLAYTHVPTMGFLPPPAGPKHWSYPGAAFPRAGCEAVGRGAGSVQAGGLGRQYAPAEEMGFSSTLPHSY